MKSYYQQKKHGFLLEKNIYAKTVKEIQCYNTYQRIISDCKNKSPINLTKNDLNNKAVAEKYVKIFEEALYKWVDESYRKAVFDYIIHGTCLDELEEKYYLSKSMIKRWVQVYIFGVATELGEDFK